MASKQTMSKAIPAKELKQEIKILHGTGIKIFPEKFLVS